MAWSIKLLLMVLARLRPKETSLPSGAAKRNKVGNYPLKCHQLEAMPRCVLNRLWPTTKMKPHDAVFK